MPEQSHKKLEAQRSSPRVDADKEQSAADGAVHSPVAPSGIRGALVNVIVPFLLIVAALAIGAALISSPPHVPKSAPESLAPVVGLAELIPYDTEVFIEAYGTVVPAREIRIIPEVAGRIVELNDKLNPGGVVVADELLIRIDPTDYEIAVAQAYATLDVAKHEMSHIRARIESLRGRGRQLDVEIAYLEWNADRLGLLAEQDSAAQSEAYDALTKLNSQKAARRTLDAEVSEQEKAVESAAAGVRVAERRLEAAKLALARTEVPVPFDAIVVSENVEKGQFVGPQTTIATLVATDEFWAEAAIPVARLRDLRFAAEGAGSPSRVTVGLATGGGEDIIRDGVLMRPLGNLDPLGRMARVLVSIRNPLGFTDLEGNPARRILLGSYVRLRIESGRLSGVFSIPRKALRENDRIWARDADGRLAIRPVNIVWRRHDDVLVENGFEPGDRLITTHLASVVPGMPLRIREEPSASGAPEDRPADRPHGAESSGPRGGTANTTP